MNTPTETKVLVSFWSALAAFWLLLLVANGARGEWNDTIDCLSSALIAAYVALLIHERDTARRFQHKVTSALRGRWSA